MCENKPKKIIDAEIISAEEKCPGYFMMELRAPEIAGSACPGQFVNVRVSGKDRTDPLLRIPLGIHFIREKSIGLLFKKVGAGTRILSGKEPGQRISLLAPLGKGFDRKNILSGDRKKAFIVAGGHGIAPLYSLAESFVSDGKEIVFFTGVNTASQLMCTDELRSLGVNVRIASIDGSVGEKGTVVDLLEESIPGADNGAEIFACGPKGMLRAVARFCAGRGLPAQVSMDEYMACGIGACLGCAVRTKNGYKLACKDGPVFRADEVLWEK
jgi:dihydroorotate dehydrogenase electron transfer subunit